MDLSQIKSQFSVWNGQYGKFLPKDKSAKILDLGCGHGGIVYWLHSIGYANAEGVDISREQISQGNDLGIKNLYHGDAESFLRDKKGYYDVILLVDVLGSLAREEVFGVLESVASSLKNGGVLILRSANAESPMAGRIRHGYFKEEVSFTEASLREILVKSGFKDIKIQPVRPVVHGLKSLIRRFFWWGIEGFLKFYRLVEAGTSKGIFTQNMIAVARKG